MGAASGPVPIGARSAASGLERARGADRCHLNRLSHVDPVTGGPARRYERSKPGELIRVDVPKFGNILDGGGWRFLGKPRGRISCLNRMHPNADVVSGTTTSRSTVGALPGLATGYRTEDGGSLKYSESFAIPQEDRRSNLDQEFRVIQCQIVTAFNC